MSKKKQKRTDKTLKKWLLPAAVLVVLAAIVGYISYSYYLDVRDRERFETVRHSVEKLQSRLQKIAAPGEKWVADTSCSQGSTKFQEPKKACILEVYAEVEVSQDTQARDLISKYSREFRNASDLFVYKGQGLPASPRSFPLGLEDGYDGASFREKKLI